MWNIGIRLSVLVTIVSASLMDRQLQNGDYQICSRNVYNFEVGQPIESINTGRDSPPTDPYILFMGQSDFEMASTMNILFGKSIADVDSNSTETGPEITEYTIRLPNNSRHLRFIHVPELVSYRSTEADLIILANWILHLRNNQESYPMPPTAVLIFSRFDDSGITPNRSTFLNLLKNISRIQESFLPTNSTSNILHVLTNFLRETKSLTKHPTSRFEEFRSVIRNNTHFPEPINLCVAENDGEGNDLPKVDDSYLLPNKELYPKNLVEAIKTLSLVSAGKIAHEAIVKAFAIRKYVNVTQKKFRILSKDDPNVIETFELLKAMEDTQISPLSEISTALSDTYNRIDKNLKRLYPGSLQFLQKIFQNKKITQKSQIPKRNYEIVTLLRGTYMNTAMATLLENAFSVKTQKMPFHPLVGFGYNILEDRLTETTPFVFHKFKFSKLGFMIPEGISASLANEEVRILLFYENMESYRKARLVKLNAPDETNTTQLTGKLRSGYNIIDSQSNRVTSTKEFRQFLFKLYQDVEFSQSFLDLLLTLSNFNISSELSVKEWDRFFDIYGTHVLISAYGGTQVHSSIVLKESELARYRSGDLSMVQCAFNREWKSNLNVKAKYKKIKMLQSNLTLVPLSELTKRVNSSVAVEMEMAIKVLLSGSLNYIPPGGPRPKNRIPGSGILASNDDAVQGQSHPALINIPDSLEKIMAQLNGSKYKFHPGLRNAEMAIASRRSPRNAYILCLGLEGAGKSSTLNFLFGRRFAAIYESFARETEIREYFANVPIPSLGVNNSQLRIIDTPGLDTSGGGVHDERAITNLTNYLSTHEDLKSALPNIVLIFSNFDDNRTVGPSSTFVKMLKAYNAIRNHFTTPYHENPNIIFALTRFLSESNKTVKRDPSNKINVFRSLIRNYTAFPEPIVISVAENEPVGMPEIGENYRLPNGELYPQNLVDRIANLSTGPANKISSEIFKQVFANRKNLDIRGVIIGPVT